MRLFKKISIILFLAGIAQSLAIPVFPQSRPRARDLGLQPGILQPGKLNAITDVDGVLVGHKTIIRDSDIRTGVTAVLPHSRNLFREKVPAAVFVANGFGKIAGTTQIEELGEIETPILLTSTLAVPKTADFLLDYMLSLEGMSDVRSINPIVAETNDGFLNDIRGRHIAREDVLEAIKAASTNFEEGSVGAGTGTVAFGFKGGIGTSSRRLPEKLGGFTVGVLVQTNFGGVLAIDGAPVGRELGKYYLKEFVEARTNKAQATTAPNISAKIGAPDGNADGSIIIVIATDAPLDARNLKRLAHRSIFGLARTGASGTNGSGDYAIAFSTGNSTPLKNDAVSPLFHAVIEATEEAIYNSLFKATTIEGFQNHRAEALPIDKTVEILKKYKRIP